MPIGSISAAIRITLEGSYDVYVAEKGMDGLNLLRDDKPDWILLSIALPDMDGLSLLDQIKKLSLRLRLSC